MAVVGLGVASAPAAAQPRRFAAPLVMRELPGSAAAAIARAEAPAARPKGDDDLDDLKPAEAKPAEAKPAEAKPAEARPAEAKPVAAKPAEAKPAEAKPAEAKPAEAKPAEAKPAEAKPAEAKPAEAKPAEAKPPPAEPKPAPAPIAARPAPSRPPPSNEAAVAATGGGAAMGQFNLRASDTADVYVDGKKVGGSPVLGHKVKPGKHKVRFDCYDASGEARPGVSQTYDVAAEGEKDVEYDCPTE